MLTAAFVILGAVAAWLLVDRLLLRRDQRLHRGHAGWSASNLNRNFHSTGWEDTGPPLEVNEVDAGPRRERAGGQAAA